MPPARGNRHEHAGGAVVPPTPRPQGLSFTLPLTWVTVTPLPQSSHPIPPFPSPLSSKEGPCFLLPQGNKTRETELPPTPAAAAGLGAQGRSRTAAGATWGGDFGRHCAGFSQHETYCPGGVAQLVMVRVTTQHAKVVGSIPGQGTHKTQQMNA